MGQKLKMVPRIQTSLISQRVLSPGLPERCCPLDSVIFGRIRSIVSFHPWLCFESFHHTCILLDCCCSLRHWLCLLVNIAFELDLLTCSLTCSISILCVYSLKKKAKGYGCFFVCVLCVCVFEVT